MDVPSPAKSGITSLPRRIVADARRYARDSISSDPAPVGPQYLDDDHAVLDSDRVSLHGHHTRGRYDLTRSHVELPAVKIALDDIAVQVALRKRAGAVSTRIVSDEELTIDVEHRQSQATDLHLECGAVRNVSGAAELNSALHAKPRNACY